MHNGTSVTGDATSFITYSHRSLSVFGRGLWCILFFFRGKEKHAIPLIHSPIGLVRQGRSILTVLSSEEEITTAGNTTSYLTGNKYRFLGHVCAPQPLIHSAYYVSHTRSRLHPSTETSSDAHAAVVRCVYDLY